MYNSRGTLYAAYQKILSLFQTWEARLRLVSLHGRRRGIIAFLTEGMVNVPLSKGCRGNTLYLLTSGLKVGLAQVPMCSDSRQNACINLARSNTLPWDTLDGDPGLFGSKAYQFGRRARVKPSVSVCAWICRNLCEIAVGSLRCHRNRTDSLGLHFLSDVYIQIHRNSCTEHQNNKGTLNFNEPFSYCTVLINFALDNLKGLSEVQHTYMYFVAITDVCILHSYI